MRSMQREEERGARRMLPMSVDGTQAGMAAAAAVGGQRARRAGLLAVPVAGMLAVFMVVALMTTTRSSGPDESASAAGSAASSTASTTASATVGVPDEATLAPALPSLDIMKMRLANANVPQEMGWQVLAHHSVRLQNNKNGARTMLETCSMATVEVTNKYTSAATGTGTPVAQDMPHIAGNYVLEPMREHTAKVLADTDARSYLWLVGGVEFQRSESVYFTPKPSEEMQLMLYEFQEGPSHKLLNVCVAPTKTRYVRRELRDLDDEDRVAFLTAFRALYNFDDEEGRAKYGPKFTSMRTLVEFHLSNAAAHDCDHLHDGQAFFMSHLLLTNKLEEALQSVDPSVAMPYWDYVLDVETVNNEHDGDYVSYFRESEIFSDKYFGRSNVETGELEDSIFADVEIFKYRSDSDVPHNMYGLLRAPWSASGSTSILRFFGYCAYVDTVGTACSDVDTLMSISSRIAVANAMAGPPHGPIHLNMGGSSQCDTARTNLEATGAADDLVDDMLELMALTHKKYWREGSYFTCPDSCVGASDSTPCSCTCTDEVYSNRSYADTLFDFGGLTTSYGDALTDEVAKVFMHNYCDSTMIEGEQLGAGGAVDPVFWLLHPTTERFFQLKILSGTEDPTSWDSWNTGAAAYIGGTADDSIAAEDCYGHQPDDRWSIVWEDRTFSNREFLDYIDPVADNCPYVYDTVDMSHCSASLGYDMTVAGVAAQYPSKVSPDDSP